MHSWLRVAHKYTWHLHLLVTTTALPAFGVLVHMVQDDVEVDIERANDTTKLSLRIRVPFRGLRFLRKKTSMPLSMTDDFMVSTPPSVGQHEPKSDTITIVVEPAVEPPRLCLRSYVVHFLALQHHSHFPPPHYCVELPHRRIPCPT